MYVYYYVCMEYFALIFGRRQRYGILYEADDVARPRHSSHVDEMKWLNLIRVGRNSCLVNRLIGLHSIK